MRRSNSMGGHRGLVALEEEVIIAADDGMAAGLPESSESVETALLEVSDSAAEVEAVADDIEETVEVVQALESIADSLRISAANGGMDKFSAGAVGTAVDSLYNRVGIKKPAMPTLESFGQTSSRIGATQLALESMSEQIKKIWDAIVAAFNRAVQWIKDFYVKVFVTTDKLNKRASALKTKAAATKGTAKEASFESASVFKALQASGKVAVDAGLGNLNTVLTGVTGAVTSGMSKGMGDSVIAILNAGKPETFELPAMPTVSGFEKIANAEQAGFAPVEGLTVYRSSELPGGMAVVLWNTDKKLVGDAAVTAFSGVKSVVGAFNPKAAEAKDAKVPTLEVAAMGKVCDDVMNVTKTLDGFKDTEKKLEELKKKCADAAKKAGNDAGKAKDDDKKKFEAMRKIAVSYQRMADQPMASLSLYTLRTLKSSLDYVEQSMKQYAA